MDHTKKIFLGGIHNSRLKSFLEIHLAECFTDKNIVTLIIDKLYAFHQIGNRKNITLIQKAIDEVFGHHFDIVLKYGKKSDLQGREKGIIHTYSAPAKV